MRWPMMRFLLCLPVCAAFATPGQAPLPGKPGRPSVLLVTLDTTRADRLGCYGSTRGLTPSLDAFAQRATVFERCQTAIPQTMPAHVTMLSGLQPNRHGVRKNLEVLVPKELPFLPEALSRAGYRTGAFVSASVLLGRFGMNRGFQVYDDRGLDQLGSGGERAAPRTLAPAFEWIAAQRGPWFCWVHLFEPHAPYEPPEPWASRFPKEPYDGEVAALDAQVGNFLAQLWQQGLLDGAAVVICGDHGEALGEHGESTHGLLLYDATTRVPLIVRLPGQEQGRRVTGPVGLVDVAPTLRELCGLGAAEGLDGVSFAAALRGIAPPPARRIYLESLEGYFDYGWAPLYGAVEGAWKFILAPRAELYDLSRDPGERANALPRERERAAAMKGWLSGELARAPAGPLEKAALSGQELALLKSLGYIAGTPGVAGASHRDPKDGMADLPEMERADRLLQEKRYAEAADVYRKLRAREPGSARFTLALATCLQHGDPQKALELAKEAIRLRPDFPQAYDRAIRLLLHQKGFAEARRLADLGVKETQDSDGTLGVLGAWAALMAGAPEAEVAGYLDRAVRRGEEGFLAVKLRALLAQRRGDTAGAVALVRRFVTLAPPQEVEALKTDPAFAPLRQEPEFWKALPKGR